MDIAPYSYSKGLKTKFPAQTCNLLLRSEFALKNNLACMVFVSMTLIDFQFGGICEEKLDFFLARTSINIYGAR